MLAQVIVVTLEVHYKEFRATLSNQIRACTAIRRLRISLSRRRMLPPFKMRRRRCKQTPESRTRGQEQEQEDARRKEDVRHFLFVRQLSFGFPSFLGEKRWNAEMR
jgi:hypothetical protein